MNLGFIFLILMLVCGVIYVLNKEKTTIENNKLRGPIQVISFIGFIVFLILFGFYFLK